MRETATIIQCPRCRQSLPGSATHCHFCGAMIAAKPESGTPHAMAGVTILTGKGAQSRDFTTWQDKAYRICCFLMIGFGVLLILMGMNIIETPPAQQAFLGVTGGIQAFFGLMLLWEQTWAQFIMKWYLILQVFADARNVLIGVMMMSVRPAVGIGYMLFSLIAGAVHGFMLYLLYTSGDV